MRWFKRLFGCFEINTPSTRFSSVQRCGVCFKELTNRYVQDNRLGIYVCEDCTGRVNLAAVSQVEGNIYHCSQCGFRFKLDFGWLGLESMGGGFYGEEKDPSYVPRCPHCGQQYREEDIV